MTPIVAWPRRKPPNDCRPRPGGGGRRPRRPAGRAGTGTTGSGRGRRPCRSTGRRRSASSRPRPGWRPRSPGAARPAARRTCRGWPGSSRPGRRGRRWPRPSESSQACHGARIAGRSSRICGIESTNSLIDVARAPATMTSRVSRIGHRQRVDDDRGEGPRQPRDARADPGDDRADDEGEQPGQEERQQDVAEVEEDRRRAGPRR